MTKITRQRARNAARNNAEAAAKLIAMQEAQIEARRRLMRPFLSGCVNCTDCGITWTR